MKQCRIIRIVTPIGYFDINSRKYSIIISRVRKYIEEYDLSYATVIALDNMLYEIGLAYINVSTNQYGNKVISIEETKEFYNYINL